MKLPICEKLLSYDGETVDIEEAARVIEALAEALEPFAAECMYSEDTHDASDCEISVKLFEIRRARAALAMAKGE